MTIIENNCIFEVTRKCSECNNHVPIQMPNHNDCIVKIEHGFMYNNKQKIADVCVLNNKSINCIYEIYYTHKTEDHERPEK